MSAPMVPPEVAAQSTERLLNLFAQLTHQIHALEREQQAMTGVAVGQEYDVLSRVADVRAQRAIVKHVILSRCSDV